MLINIMSIVGIAIEISYLMRLKYVGFNVQKGAKKEALGSIGIQLTLKSNSLYWFHEQWHLSLDRWVLSTVFNQPVKAGSRYSVFCCQRSLADLRSIKFSLQHLQLTG